MKENKKHFSLTELVILSLIGKFLNFFSHRANAVLPQRVGVYNFDSSLEKRGPKKEFLLGIYKNSKGQKAFAKMWSNNFKDFNYYSLKNEIQVYKVLNSALNKVQKDPQAHYKRMAFPKLITFEEKENYLIMLAEYVNGKESTALTSEKKVELYFKTLEFIHFLGTKLTSKERAFLSKRSPLNFVILYPILIIKAILSHPRTTLNLLKGVPVLLRCLPILIKENKLVLNHRDLHFGNILITKNHDFVIDFQLCALTHPLHDIVTTLRHTWGEDYFYIEFLKEIIRRNYTNSNFEILFKGLCVNSATHGLTDNSFPERKIDLWIDYLKLAINFKLQNRMGIVINK